MSNASNSADRDQGIAAPASAMARNDWYRDQYRKAWRMMYLLGFMTILSLSLNTIQFVNRPHPSAFGLTPDLRAIPLRPLSDELSPDSVRQWAARVAVQCFSFDFAKYRSQLNALESLFTDDGYNGFLQGLQRSDLERYVKSQNYVVSAVTSEAPSIVKSSVASGIYTWVLKVPLVVTYQSGASANTQNLIVTLVAIRVPEDRNPSGIAIRNLIAVRR